MPLTLPDDVEKNLQMPTPLEISALIAGALDQMVLRPSHDRYT
jgi:hypothetical protein